MKYDWLESVVRESIETSKQWGEDFKVHQKTEQAQIKKERDQQKKEKQAAKAKQPKQLSEDEVLYVPKEDKGLSKPKEEAPAPSVEQNTKEFTEPYYTGVFDNQAPKKEKTPRDEKPARKGGNNKRGGRDQDYGEYVPKQTQNKVEESVYVPKNTVAHHTSKDAKPESNGKSSVDHLTKTTSSNQQDSQGKHTDSHHQSSTYSAFPPKGASSKQKYYEDDDDGADDETYKKILSAPKSEPAQAPKKTAEAEAPKQSGQGKHGDKSSTAPPGIETGQRVASNQGGSHAHNQSASHSGYSAVAGQAIGGPTTTAATTSGQRSAEQSHNHPAEQKSLAQNVQTQHATSSQPSVQSNATTAVSQAQPVTVPHSHSIQTQLPVVSVPQPTPQVIPNISQSLGVPGVPMMVQGGQMSTQMQTLYSIQSMNVYGPDGQIYQQQYLVPVQVPVIPQYNQQMLAQPTVMQGAGQQQVFYPGMQMQRVGADPNSLNQQVYMSQQVPYTTQGHFNPSLQQPHSKP